VTRHDACEIAQFTAGIGSFGIILDYVDETARISGQITASVPDYVRPRAERPRAVEHSGNRNPIATFMRRLYLDILAEFGSFG